jgi:probable aminopeptidase NPEPL1
MPASLRFDEDPAAWAKLDTLLVIGRKARLLDEDVLAILPKSVPREAWQAMVDGDVGDGGRASTTHTGGTPRKVIAGVLPEGCSRHNAPSRAWAIPGLVKAMGKRGPQGILFALEQGAHAFASATALTRALPAWTGTSRKGERTVHIAFSAPEGVVPDLERLALSTEATRMAASWVDMPPDQLGTKKFVTIARNVARKLSGVHIKVAQGHQLREQGLGGLWGVGRAAKEPPALVVLDHAPEGATRKVSWVGKGIVYDTGGLSMKTRTSMIGMKTDMGGAAAVLAAFWAAVKLGCPHNLTAVLCIAENMVGPDAIRPDDVLTLFSGKTVEVNNTDAEGRLVLADGVAWAVKYREPDDLVDLATLTGAQSMATGKGHGALYCNDEAFEREAVEAGRRSGNTVHPLPYAPELYRGEFTSQVADMRNSVKNRNNAQSSCAGQFIANHIQSFEGRWLHVDMAGPVWAGGRATGFGVPLLLTLAGVGAQ